MRPICTSMASVSRVRCPFEFGSVRMSGLISALWSVFNLFIFVSSSGENLAGWFFHTCLFSKAAILAKFSTNCRNTLRSSGKNLSPVRDVDGLSLSKALAVFNTISKRLG